MSYAGVCMLIISFSIFRVFIVIQTQIIVELWQSGSEIGRTRLAQQPYVRGNSASPSSFCYTELGASEFASKARKRRNSVGLPFGNTNEW